MLFRVGLLLVGSTLCCTAAEKALAQSTSSARADLANIQTDPDTRIYVSDTQPGCSGDSKIVNDLAAYAAFVSYQGVDQTAQQLVYSRSQCFDGKHLNRWKLDVGVAHLGGGGFTSDSVNVGLGAEIHPFKRALGISLIPVARVAYDDFHRAGHQFSWGGELTAQYIGNIDTPLEIDLAPGQSLPDGRNKVYSPGRQIILAARAAYQRQSISFTTRTAQSYERLTGFAMIGLDSHFKDRRWRWQSNLSYQSLEGGAIKGYGSLEVSFRHLSADYQTFRRSYKITGNGGGKYKAILFSVDFRF